MAAWKLEAAKARLSEVVRHARDDGPQIITVRGADTAVLLSAADYRRLLDRSESGSASWVDRFRDGFTGEIDLSRDTDAGGDFSL